MHYAINIISKINDHYPSISTANNGMFFIKQMS